MGRQQTRSSYSHFPFLSSTLSPPSPPICCISQFHGYRLWFGFDQGTDTTDSSSHFFLVCWVLSVIFWSSALLWHTLATIAVCNVAMAEGTYLQKRSNQAPSWCCQGWLVPSGTWNHCRVRKVDGVACKLHRKQSYGNSQLAFPYAADRVAQENFCSHPRFQSLICCVCTRPNTWAHLLHLAYIKEFFFSGTCLHWRWSNK